MLLGGDGAVSRKTLATRRRRRRRLPPPPSPSLSRADFRTSSTSSSSSSSSSSRSSRSAAQSAPYYDAADAEIRRRSVGLACPRLINDNYFRFFSRVHPNRLVLGRVRIGSELGVYNRPSVCGHFKTSSNRNVFKT